MIKLPQQHMEMKKITGITVFPKITMRKVLLFLVTFWVIIYSNSRMLEVPSYKFVHLFPIPHAARIVELVLLFFLFLLAFTTKMPKKTFIISLCTLIYFLLAFGNLIVRGTLTLDSIQDLYIRVAPFLLFTILSQGNTATREELLYFVKFFGIVLLINIAAFFLFQLPTGVHEDNYSGYFEDAHLFCNVLLIFSVVLFYDYLKNKRRRSVLFSIALLVISIYPSNEKVIALMLVVMGLMYLRHILNRKSLFAKSGIIFLLLFLGFGVFKYAQNKDGGQLWYRAQILYNNFGVENIGPVIAWPMAVHEMKESAFSLFFGLGAGQYGWIAASRNVLDGKGSVHSKLFEFEFSNENLNNAGYLFRTNTWSSLLAEFGLIGATIFIWVLVSIIRGVRSYKTEDRLECNLRTAFYLIILIVVYQGFFTPYSNWSVSALMFPAIYLGTYFNKSGLDIKRREINKVAE